MSVLETWLENGWIKRHQTSPEEVVNLLAIAAARLSDAREMARDDRISLDLQLTALFIAARVLAEIALRVSGYRVAASSRHHELTIGSVPHTMGREWRSTQQFFEVIRRERIIVEYESVGRATTQQIAELTAEVSRFHRAVIELAQQRGFVSVADS